MSNRLPSPNSANSSSMKSLEPCDHTGITCSAVRPVCALRRYHSVNSLVSIKPIYAVFVSGTGLNHALSSLTVETSDGTSVIPGNSAWRTLECGTRMTDEVLPLVPLQATHRFTNLTLLLLVSLTRFPHMHMSGIIAMGLITSHHYSVSEHSPALRSWTSNWCHHLTTKQGPIIVMNPDYNQIQFKYRDQQTIN